MNLHGASAQELLQRFRDVLSEKKYTIEELRDRMAYIALQNTRLHSQLSVRDFRNAAITAKLKALEAAHSKCVKPLPNVIMAPKTPNGQKVATEGQKAALQQWQMKYEWLLGEYKRVAGEPPDYSGWEEIERKHLRPLPESQSENQGT